MKMSGKCLCGSVELEVDVANTEVSACHCSMCSTWIGGPMMAIEAGDTLKVLNDASVARYPSSDWAERGFCKECGTHLFYYLKPSNEYHMPVGLLDSDKNLTLTHQIFIDEKPSYYSFSNDTKNMTGAEVFAHFESNE